MQYTKRDISNEYNYRIPVEGVETRAGFVQDRSSETGSVFSPQGN